MSVDLAPGLCVGLCVFCLCVAVTQIVVGVAGPGGAIQRVMLVVGLVRSRGLPVAGGAAERRMRH